MQRLLTSCRTGTTSMPANREVREGEFTLNREQMREIEKAQELLRECLLAFKAIPQANTSRNLLKLWGVHERTPYGGTGSLILAEHMVAKLGKFLGEENDNA